MKGKLKVSGNEPKRLQKEVKCLNPLEIKALLRSLLLYLKGLSVGLHRPLPLFNWIRYILQIQVNPGVTPTPSNL